MTIGTGIGPPTARLIYEETGTYKMFMWVTIGLSFIAGITMRTFPRYPRS